MNPQRLLQHFDRIAEAPDAVARLRRFVLDLAVRGKLVEQDPDEAPASALLEPHPTSKGAFPLPASWAWIDVRSVADTRLGKMLDKSKNKGTLRPYLRNINVRWFDFDLSDLLQMPFENTELAEFALRDGDVLICEGGEPGRAAVWDKGPQEIYFQKAIHRVRFGLHVDPWFFVKALKASADDGRLRESFTGTGIKHLTGKSLAAYRFPLPPLAEQHRIVAKVDELMALCDRLEAAQAEREQRRDRLVAASLNRLNQPTPAVDDEPAPAFREYARFHLDHLPRLTTRPEHIKSLRQTILNLAIRGKLVEQDPNDEPASELLTRIRLDKERLARNRKFLRESSDEAWSPENAPFHIPASWAWVPFGQIVISRDGERIPVSKEERSHRAKVYDYYGASGVIDKIDDYLFDKPLLLIGEDGANLINRSTPIAFIAHGKYWVNNHAHVLDGFSKSFLRYMELHINAIDLKPYVTGTAQPKMNQAKMNSIPIALPPEGEQHRIVAKVDELMAVCDQLETQLTTTQTDTRRLLQAVLHEALA